MVKNIVKMNGAESDSSAIDASNEWLQLTSSSGTDFKTLQSVMNGKFQSAKVLAMSSEQTHQDDL